MVAVFPNPGIGLIDARIGTRSSEATEASGKSVLPKGAMRMKRAAILAMGVFEEKR